MNIYTRYIYVGFFLFLWAPTCIAKECVILLHGLGLTEVSMSWIADSLSEQGYEVWNKGYPSTEENIQTLSRNSIEPAMRHCENYAATHFVTHSLGGILVRFYLQGKDFDGRIVMISPPNQGSEVPDVLQEIELFKSLLGPAALQLGTGESSIPNSLLPIGGQIGVITGDSTSDPWFSWLIPGPDDGKVSVESAQLEEMQDFLVVPHGHTFIMLFPGVIDQVLYFLQQGMFRR
jgi:triacylglycerol lipase